MSEEKVVTEPTDEPVKEGEEGGQEKESVLEEMFERSPITEVVVEAAPEDTPKEGGEVKKEEVSAPVVAVGEDKTEWEKRYKDQQKFLQETRIENRELKRALMGVASEVKTLRDVAVKHHKELHPDDIFPEPTPPPSTEPEPQAVALVNRVKEAEEMVKAVYTDYDVVVGKSGEDNSPFSKAVAKKPHLLQQVFTAPNPALEAYNIGKDYVNREKWGQTPEEMRVNIEKEVREAIAKEMKGKDKELKAAALPTTLRKVASKEGEPETKRVVGLRQIFGR